jgi:hypothetical protein
LKREHVTSETANRAAEVNVGRLQQFFKVVLRSELTAIMDALGQPHLGEPVQDKKMTAI